MREYIISVQRSSLVDGCELVLAGISVQRSSLVDGCEAVFGRRMGFESAKARRRHRRRELILGNSISCAPERTLRAQR
jgi:hypothetical protein